MSSLTGRKALVLAGAGLIAVMAIASVPLVSTLSAHAAPRAHAAANVSHTSRPSMFSLEHPRTNKIAPSGMSSVFTASCNAPAGTKVIDVVESIANDADSGQAGDYWAFDNYSRHIQVWNVGPDMWCALVTNPNTSTMPSQFQAIAGQKSPGTTSTTGGILTGDEHGGFKGGYEATFTAQFDISDSANWPLHGKVQPTPVDYHCDQYANCPGYIDWTAKYFQNVTNFQEPAWGWIYAAADKPDGVWTNAATGNSGDILDRD